jgi:shikimate dehydrogenase
VNQDGRLTGYNTDVYGFLTALDLDLHFNPAGKRVLILGAGGACRAAVVALGQAGVKWVGLANRTYSRAEALAHEFSQVFEATDFSPFHLEPRVLTKALEGIDLLVNTSSVGLKGDSFDAFPWAEVPSAIPVMDIVYSQQDTPFVTTARAYGHKASGGLGMLAAQGEKAFQLWTGVAPATGLMRKCLMERSS